MSQPWEFQKRRLFKSFFEFVSLVAEREKIEKSLFFDWEQLISVNTETKSDH